MLGEMGHQYGPMDENMVPLWLADLTGLYQTIASMCGALKYTLVGAFKHDFYVSIQLGME